MKKDELDLLLAIYTKPPSEMVREVIARTRINHKRAWYLLSKWATKGWYEYGVTLDLGWLTTVGKQAADSLTEKKEN